MSVSHSWKLVSGDGCAVLFTARVPGQSAGRLDWLLLCCPPPRSAWAWPVWVLWVLGVAFAVMVLGRWEQMPSRLWIG